MFKKIELGQKLFDFSIGGEYVWDYLRSIVFNNIAKEIGLLDRGISRFRDIHGLTDKAYLNILRYSLTENPFFIGGEKDLLVFGHPRRRLLEDGRYWDVYTDTFIEDLRMEYLTLEGDYQGGHLRPAKTDCISSLDFMQLKKFIQRPWKKTMVSKKDSMKISSLEEEVRQGYGVDVELKPLIEDLVKQIFIYRDNLGKILDKFNPKAVIQVVHYNLINKTLNAVCKRRGIPTIELAHGMITGKKIAYNYPEIDRAVTTFPDYIFVWGDYSRDTTSFPIPEENVIPTGFPFFEKEYSRYSSKKKNNIGEKKIIIISQWDLLSKMADFACRLAEMLPKDFRITYKLHPRSYSRWRRQVPFLDENEKINVIEGDNPELYSLFNDSCIQVGVYSTAIYEGLAFGLKTYIIDLPGHENLSMLLEKNLACKVGSPEELIKNLDWEGEKTGKDYFFKKNARENIIKGIKSSIN